MKERKRIQEKAYNMAVDAIYGVFYTRLGGEMNDLEHGGEGGHSRRGGYAAQHPRCPAHARPKSIHDSGRNIRLRAEGNADAESEHRLTPLRFARVWEAEILSLARGGPCRSLPHEACLITYDSDSA